MHEANFLSYIFLPEKMLLQFTTLTVIVYSSSQGSITLADTSRHSLVAQLNPNGVETLTRSSLVFKLKMTMLSCVPSHGCKTWAATSLSDSVSTDK